MARLTYQQRKEMPKKSFAVPEAKTKENPAGRGAYPVPDKAHARNALARVAQHGTPEEKAQVRATVARRYPGIGQARGERKGRR